MANCTQLKLSCLRTTLNIANVITAIRNLTAEACPKKVGGMSRRSKFLIESQSYRLKRRFGCTYYRGLPDSLETFAEDSIIIMVPIPKID